MIRRLLLHRLRILAGYDPPYTETTETPALQLRSQRFAKAALQEHKAHS